MNSFKKLLLLHICLCLCCYIHIYILLNQYPVLICIFHIISLDNSKLITGIKKDAAKQFLKYSFCYRYEGLDQALQCTNYLRDNEKNVGCKLSDLESSDYKDFFICVNGSSNTEPVRSSYTVFQLQNIGEI